MWVALFVWLSPLLLLLLTFAIGKIIERRHLRSLARREREISGMLVTNLREPPPGFSACEPSLCVGSVVIASDHFKRFGAWLKTLVGGRLRTLETLLGRGRREAILRMLEQARAAGADMVCNVRIETARLGTSTASDQKMFAAAAEVVVYGTAVRQHPAASPYRSAMTAQT